MTLPGVTTTESSAGDVAQPIAWLTFLGGPIAWTLHLMLAYAIGEFGCVAGVGSISLLGISGITWAVLFVSVLMFAAAVAATAAGYLHLRDRDHLLESAEQAGTGASYLVRAGVVLSAGMAIVIFGQSLPLIFYLDGC